MRSYNLLLILLLLVTSCEKEVVTIIHEPDKLLADSVKPVPFLLFIDEVTDTRIKLHWTKSIDETSDVSYEILVSDSVIAYGSFPKSEYVIGNLVPETEYSISVIALDQERNSFTVTSKATTKKSFYSKIISFNPDYYFYRFDRVIEASEGGLLICGRYIENQYAGYVTFILRLDREFNIVWHNENFSGIKDIKQISSGCFLITGSDYVSKIDGNGNELWRCPVKLGMGELASAIENNSGQIITVGSYWTLPGVTVKYYIAQVSGTGVLMWQKSAAPARSNFFTDIIQKQDGRYLVLGIHEANYLNGEWIRSEWLVETDEQGNITRENDYMSSFHDDDMPSGIIRWSGGNYLLAGSTVGCLPPYYHVNVIPRFILVSPGGSVIWDKTHTIAAGTNEYFRSYVMEEDNSILFLSSTYEESAYAWLDLNGAVSNKTVLSDLPESIFLKKDGFNKYVLAHPEGFIIVINKDGYRQP